MRVFRLGHWRAAIGAALAVLWLATGLASQAWAQLAPGHHRIGVLLVGRPPPPNQPPPDLAKASGALRAFTDHLAERGYVPGRNLTVELREGEYEHLPALAAELQRLKVDVIFTAGTMAARIVQRHVKTTPLVIYSCDPHEHVERLARPAGNVTGATCMTTELSPKRLELLKELLPRASHVVIFGDPDDAPLGWRLTREAAPRLGVRLSAASYHGRDGIAAGLQAVAAARPEAVLVYPDAILVRERSQLASFAIEHRLPTMHVFPEMAEAGGLMSYGASSEDMFVDLADQVAQILDGARPADLPIRRARRFYLVINLKTARAIGVTVPASLLARADRLIE